MASGTGHSKEIEELKLRGIGTFWFLDIGGKLKRLAILDDAQNVSLVNNVIFAGDKLYQVFTNEDSEIVVSEIEDVRSTTNTAQKIKGNNTVPDIDRNDNGENSGSAENAPNNAETNKESDDVVNGTEDACQNSSYDTETSFDRSGDGESARSAENVPHNVLSSSDDTYLHAFVTKSERDNAFSSDSDEDYNLEKGHEEYIVQKEKGIFRGIFQLLKKAVKRHPGERQKMLNKKAEPLYEDVPYVGIESAASNIGSDIEDEGRTDEDMTNITTNTDEVPGAKIVTALYDFKAFLDDEISFKKNDRFKICGGGNSSDSEWCSAEHLGTGRKGYIPRAYVTNNMSSLENMECWFNVDSHASETLLLSSDFPLGTFLLRPSSGKERQKGKGTSMCTLSMLFRDAESERTSVVHYKIKQHMGEVFIFADRSFSSISELLHYYKRKQDLKCELRGTVPKDSPVVYPRKMEVARKSLGQMVPIECGKYRFLFSGKLFDTLDVTVAKLSTEETTTEEFMEATAVLHNFRYSKAKIVPMIAVSFEPESYFVVLGETIYCTLKEYLHTNRNKKLTRNALFQYAAQVADGMAFLERNNVVNRYLRAACVFVCYPYVVKIAHPRFNDLIFGSVASGNVQDPFEMDKWKWTAPEAINDEQKYSTKSDVWSYGVLLYELITFGEEPYKGLSAEEALLQIGRGNRPKRPYDSTERCPLAFYVTMLKCWHELPECRPTFEFLKELFLDFDNTELLDTCSEELISCGNIDANAAKIIEQQKKQESGGSHRDSQPTNMQPTERNGTNKTFEQATNKSEDRQGRRGACVKALYSFGADDDDEISLNVKDVITDVDLIDEGWWIGTAPDGKRGMFPSNYVEMLSSEGDNGEINMKENDIITDVDPIDDDCWSTVTACDGKRGTFLSNSEEVLEHAVHGLYSALEKPCQKIRPPVHLGDLEVSKESVKLLRKLDSGTFVDIYAGMWCNTVDVAVKTLKQGKMTTENFLEGAKLMRHLQHNKLIQLMAVCTKSEPIWIITEAMINGTLRNYLRKDDGKNLQIEDLTDMAGQIADGMAYLETKKCVLIDLRAAVILIGDHNEVKLAEFSFACLFQGDIYEATNDTMVPLKWIAPEAAYDQMFSTKSDVWSFGVVLYELITFGKNPYPGKKGEEVIELVQNGYRMPKPTGGPVPCPEPYYEIMLKCWNRDADIRPTFSYLHDFFKNYKISSEEECQHIED